MSGITCVLVALPVFPLHLVYISIPIHSPQPEEPDLESFQVLCFALVHTLTDQDKDSDQQMGSGLLRQVAAMVACQPALVAPLCQCGFLEAVVEYCASSGKPEETTAPLKEGLLRLLTVCADRIPVCVEVGQFTITMPGYDFYMTGALTACLHAAGL